jgi:hypothetical protein
MTELLVESCVNSTWYWFSNCTGSNNGSFSGECQKVSFYLICSSCVPSGGGIPLQVSVQLHSLRRLGKAMLKENQSEAKFVRKKANRLLSPILTNWQRSPIHCQIRWSVLLACAISSQHTVADNGEVLSHGGMPPHSRTQIQPLEDRIGRLLVIRDAIKSNIDRIETWTGTFEFQDRLYHDEVQAKALLDELGVAEVAVGDGMTRVDQGTFDFAFDAKGQRCYSSYNARHPVQYTSLDTKETFFTADSVTHQRSVVTPEHFLHCNLSLQFGMIREAPTVTIGPLGFREQASSAERLTQSVVLDPRSIFT